MRTILITASDVRAIVDRVGLDAIMDENIRRIHEAFRDYRPVSRSGVGPGRLPLRVPPRRTAGDDAGAGARRGGHDQDRGLSPREPQASRSPDHSGHGGRVRGGIRPPDRLVDGTFLTALRTAATSAVASRHLASPRSETLGLIGCGGQSVAQLHALSRVFDLKRVLTYDLVPERAASVAARASRFCSPSLEIRSVPLRELVATADIICTQTSVGVGEGPVFEDGVTRPHLHVNAVGADLPNKFEIPLALLKRSLVVPDFPAQTALEGECQRLEPADIGPSLIEIVQNPELVAAARDRTTVFDSTGFALEDHMTAAQCSSTRGRPASAQRSRWSARRRIRSIPMGSWIAARADRRGPVSLVASTLSPPPSAAAGFKLTSPNN